MTVTATWATWAAVIVRASLISIGHASDSWLANSACSAMVRLK
jgi:hypothetical protein